MVVTLGANDVALERGMENWVFGIFCLALLAVPKDFSPGGRVSVRELGRGDANNWAIACMQCGNVFVRPAGDNHPGIVEVACSCRLRAWIAAQWVQEDIVKCSCGDISNGLSARNVRWSFQSCRCVCCVVDIRAGSDKREQMGA